MAKTGTIKINGSSFKIKKERSFLGGTLYLTKEGWAAQPPNSYELLTGFDREWDAEAAVFDYVSARNAVRSRYCYHVRDCIPRDKATQLARDWGEMRDGEKIHWFEEGGLAVAVRLDSLGNAVDYLSLDEWSNKYHWSLPDGWEFFHNNLDLEYRFLKV